MRIKTANILKRLASVIVILALSLQMVGAIMEYAYSAGSYSILGTNKALGSPILNDNFSADDWNKWEMICWGVFLSNFITPFIDDYNSAFNLDSGYGSQGSGVQALEFGTGRDPANSATIQDLLNYAVNQQSSGGSKPIYVSYSKVVDNKITEKNAFESAGNSSDTTTTTTADDSSTTTEDSDTATEDDITGETSTTADPIRAATVADLLFSTTKADNTTYAETSNTNIIFKIKLHTTNYNDMAGLDGASVPTFAVKTTSGTYETVFDYTDGYDLSILEAALVKGLCSDFAKEFGDMMNTVLDNPTNYKLVLDCFGNICTMIDGTYRVIIPAAANKYLTTNPSINLVNSLIFNANVNTAGQDAAVLYGGQGKNGFLTTFLVADSYMGGVPAISNGVSGIPTGSMLLFYDTDTIVQQDAIAAGMPANDLEVSLEGVSLGNFEVDLGQTYKKLFQLDITDNKSQPYAFKIEPANIGDIDFSNVSSDTEKQIENTITAVTQLINVFNTSQKLNVLTTIKTDTGDLNIFDDAVVVPVQIEESHGYNWVVSKVTGNTLSNRAIYRQFVNWVYQASQKNYDTSVGSIKTSDVYSYLDNSKTVNKLFNNLLTDEYGNLTTLFKSFVARKSDFYEVDLTKLKSESYSGSITLDANDILTGTGAQSMLLAAHLSNNSFKLKSNISGYLTEGGAGAVFTDTGASPFARSIKLYTTSEVMRSIANILGVREGTEFAVYSTYIYLTYLDWYGISSTSLSSLNSDGNTSNFNTRIFDDNMDVLKTDINSITEVLSEEQKEKQILDWTYMLLNPTAGREYRSQMIISGISDWIYDNYQKIVYGNASSYYDTGSGVTSRNSTGFLALSPYSENFMTAWFVNNYAYFASILIGVFFILTIVIGILRRRKFTWFLTSIIVMVNMILILPATGDIVPLMSNNFVQNMFSDKMTYWAVSENVTNATMEADYVSGNTISTSYLTSLSQTEQAQVINMVKNLNVLYTDRSLNIKQDISKKVTQTATSTYEDVQQLRSVRWMLPMIMRQFTASDGSANYVYVPMGDVMDDLSNMYWYFNPKDTEYVSTVNAKQTGNIPSFDDDKSSSLNIEVDRPSYYGAYVLVEKNYDPTLDATYMQQSYKIRNENNNTHLYSYFLQSDLLQNYIMPDYEDYKSYDEWAKACAQALYNITYSGADFSQLEREIEQIAGTYNRFDRTTVSGVFSYLWATENPLHYFYDGIKESFASDGSYGNAIGEIQGSYVTLDDGREIRKSFMHMGETGYIKDVLDLENMFKNMIPYLYSMQLAAEGYDDVQGYFEDGDLIEDYSVYTGNNKSWLFRSNWVTKIMENKDYHTSATVRKSDGTTVKVANMLLPSCYPDDRPMVFSEAQMHEQGLNEADLSLIELKCVEVNNEVSKKWTLLLNYVAVGGMTKEVLIRQMALDSLFTFNSEFSPVGITNAAYSMYPTGLDLRSISFDSVMKMLMLNVTHDTSYIYGDTMQTIVEDSDIFTAILLLVTAFICAFLIPLARNVCMGLIFFLGLWALAWAVFKPAKTKAKVSCGYVLSNFTFLIMTFVYYLAFRAIMAMTATDEVLTLSQIEINTGNPVWCLIFVLFISIMYCVGIYKMVQLCVKHYRDMGFEIYAGIAEMAAGGIANTIENLGAKLSGQDTEVSSGRRKATSTGKGDPVEVTYADRDSTGRSTSQGGTSGSGGSSQVDVDRRQTSGEDGGPGSKDDYSTSSYTDSRYYQDTPDSYNIDQEINKGKEIEQKEKEKEEKKKDKSLDSDRTQEPK